MTLYKNCNNQKYLSWEMLFRLLSAVSDGGCAALRTIEFAEPGSRFALNEDGGFLLNEDGDNLEFQGLAGLGSEIVVQRRPDSGYQLRPDGGIKLRP